MNTRALRSQQTWFADAITAPECDPVPAGDQIEGRLTAGPRASAQERLEVYRRAYHARLVEALLDDFPAVACLLGDAFEDLCRRYVAAFPSRSVSLNAYGAQFPSFCRSETKTLTPLASREFVGDLAALEWSIVEVIHAPTSEPLSLEGLAALPVEQWADARLSGTPSSRILRSDYPVNGHYQAFREHGSAAVPPKASSAVLVCRQGPTIWRMDLTPPMTTLLESLRAGETLGKALECASLALADEAEEVVATRLLAWFRDWVASGVFVRIEV